MFLGYLVNRKRRLKMSGRTSQRKGRAGELELAKILQTHGYDVQPGQAVSYGATPDLTGLPHIHVECKRNERLNIHAAMAQAERDADHFRDGLPVVFHRRNRSGWLTTMRLDDWLTLYDKAIAAIPSGRHTGDSG